MTEQEIKQQIQTAIKSFTGGNLTENSFSLFSVLGYDTSRRMPLEPKTYNSFKNAFSADCPSFNEEAAIVSQWKHVDLLFQAGTEDIQKKTPEFNRKIVLKDDGTKIDIESYLFFCIELSESEYTRSALARITREINKIFSMPAMVLFKHGKHLTLSVINRRIHKRDEQKDVLEKVTLIKDISIENPHRAHIEILFDLSFDALLKKYKFTNFAELHEAWQKTLDTKELNKLFYRDLSSWYFWAIHEVTFPGRSVEADKHGLYSKEEKVREHNATNLIRLLTRLLFVWFIKEKKLIPEELFDEEYIKNRVLADFEPGKKKKKDDKTAGSMYYRAILQNLFFASLNQESGKREFRKDKQHMNVTNLMRYESYFKDPELFIKLVEDNVPFMNGGLFECLDSPDPLLKGKKGGDVIIYEDGFSDRKDNILCVPDYIFFGISEHADLSEELGDKNKKDVTVSGLINILKSYKFTVTENTPIEEDVALDPELLGRVFENLLASYNPETKTTARKQTGSFYTPREIVNYMVDESLKAYLKQKLENDSGMNPEEAERRLDLLIGYTDKYFDDDNRFDEKHTTALINALDNCKILDPACGSGAFPMGALHKMVHILHKLDSDNSRWRKLQTKKTMTETEATFKIGDKKERETRLIEINNAFDENMNNADYARKLFLVENCIYGVDIQPIVTQISKLRFFISLIVDQKPDKTKDNFGIRPLPNLETKFVAANTLVGIEKPDADMSLFIDPKVDELEKKLKDVRHRLFSAKTPTTKRKLREEDKNLREKMGEILEDAGWSYDSARQLADWDPYNQNSSSSWFDPEWMFGVTDGFDVIIGNPPYKILTKNNTVKTELELYLRKYYAIKNSYSKNLYTLFIEKSIELLKKKSNLSFIVPEGLYKTRSYIKCVELMEKVGTTIKIVTFSDFVFENAVTGNLIFLYQKQLAMPNVSLHFDKNYNLSEKQVIKQRGIIQIENDSVELKSVATVFKGMVVKDRNKVLSEEQGNSKDLFLLGKHIAKWRIKSNLYTDYDSLIIVGGTKKLEKHRQVPRILIRRTGNIICCALLQKAALTESTLYSLWSKNPEYTNLYLLGLLNSKVLNYYNKTLNITNQQGFPQILMTDLQLLPIRKPVSSYKMYIELLVAIILFKENSVIESILNAIVCNLYFPDHMKELKIDILPFVEKDITEVIHGRDFEALEDNQKKQVIAELHKRWSNPENEIVKRMNSFAEKSPDILKVILES